MSNQEKGRLYEIYVRDYIINTLKKPAYLWKDIPERILIESGLIHSNNEQRLRRKAQTENPLRDVGIDILQQNDEKSYTFVQCKNGYSSSGICVEHLAGFFMKMYYHREMNGAVYYTSKLSVNLTDNIKITNDGSSAIDFIKLQMPKKSKPKIEPIVPYDYQIEAMNTIMEHFKTNDKSILALPCGCGKTYTSYMISNHFECVIIISPLKQFAKQTMDKYIEYSYNVENTLLIDSDGTRDITEIEKFIAEHPKYLISATYKSVDIIQSLIDRKLMNNVLIIVDEFHNLSKTNMMDKDNDFYKVLSSDNKFLLMSATPRIYEFEDLAEDAVEDVVEDAAKDAAEDSAEDVAKDSVEDSVEDFAEDAAEDSVEDSAEDSAGPAGDSAEDNDSDCSSNAIIDLGDSVYQMSFADAIKNNYITDYRIYLPSIHEKNEDLVSSISNEVDVLAITNEMRAKCIFLFKCLLQFGSKKCIVYCKDTTEIKEMTTAISILNKFYVIDYNMQCITSAVSHKKRQEKLNTFAISNKIELLFSIRIMDECIDIPSCDSIFMTHHCSSKIRMVQRLCRCIRKDPLNPFKVGNVYIWCSEYEDILETLSGIKEYDENFDKKVKVIEVNWNKNGGEATAIAEDKQMIDNYVVGIKPFVMSTWDEKFEQVKNYINENKKRPAERSPDINIKILGCWIGGQLQKYKTDKTSDRMKRWGEFILVNKNIFKSDDEIWDEKFEQVKKYINENKKRPAQSSTDITIKKLGNWISGQLQKYKTDKTSDKMKKWEEYVNNNKDIFKTWEELWNENFQKLKEFIIKYNKQPTHASKNNDEKYLARWITHQKTFQKLNKCSIQMKEWTDYLSINKQYFSSNDEKWNDNFQKLNDYVRVNKKRPTETSKNINEGMLGKWMSRQQRKYLKNNTSDKMKQWENFMTTNKHYLISKDKWNNSFQNLKDFLNKNNKRPNSISKNIEERKLGQWTIIQHNFYNNNKLDNEKITQWKELMLTHKKYFMFDNELWIDKFKTLKEYIEKHKKHPITSDKNINTNNKKLALWYERQIHNYKYKLKIMKNEEIRNLWEAFTIKYSKIS